jgi:hypothetical protein
MPDALPSPRAATGVMVGAGHEERTCPCAPLTTSAAHQRGVTRATHGGST